MAKPSLAIVGSGMAAATLTHLIGDAIDVTIFESAPTVGGRLRMNQLGIEDGCQFFIVTKPLFKQFLAPFIQDNQIKSWNGRFAEIDYDSISRIKDWDDRYPHYITSQEPSLWIKSLLSKATIYTNHTVTDLSFCRTHQQWQPHINHRPWAKHFDWVVYATPPTQASVLAKHSRVFDTIKHIKLQSCYALSLICGEAINVPFDAALIKNAPLSWMSVMQSKRPNNLVPPTSLVTLAANSWADAHQHLAPAEIQELMLEHLVHIVPDIKPLIKNSTINLQFWPQANSKKSYKSSYMVDTNLQLASIGDWHVKTRIEGAFLSAYGLADCLIAHVNGVNKLAI